MGIFNWSKRRSQVEQLTEQIGELKKQIEKYSYFDGMTAGGFGWTQSMAGIQVTPRTAMTLDTVIACVRAISEDVASLPMNVYRKLPSGGKTKIEDDPVWRCFNVSPNDQMDAFVFREYINACLLQWGNAYCEIETFSNGDVCLWPIPPSFVEPMRRKDGTVYYYISENGTFIDEWKMLHFVLFTSDGLRGISPIMLGKDAIGLGKAQEEFASTFFRNGCTTSGVVTHPGTLSPQAKQHMQEIATHHHNADNAHRLLVLQEGMKYDQISVPPEAAQMLQSRVYQTQTICRLFRIDPSIIGEHSNSHFSNVEQQNTSYATRCIRPHCRRLENQINRKLFKNQDQLFVQHDLAELKRGDRTAQDASYTAGRMGGWYMVNEIREQEGLNPVDGGDVLLQPLNMTPIGEPPGTSNDADDGSNDPQGIGQEPSAGTPPIEIGVNLVSASLDNIQDGVDRMIRREIEAIKQAAKNPKGFLTAIDTFYAKQETITERALRSSVKVWSTITNKTAPNLAKSIVDTGRDELLALSGEATADNLAALVETWADNRLNKVQQLVQRMAI